MAEKRFISGNEAVAYGVLLSRPHVIAAYPITPQTIVVERLAEMVADGILKSEYLHVESEHSALSAMIGASAVGARTFTATSSQGLVYMAECLHYASGGRFPIVMMNANRSLALPWSIYGDQRDSLSLLDCGWIQAYAEDAQESLDLIIQAYAIAEHREVLTPVMINLDGFVLTHTYEVVSLPDQEVVDQFLPPFETTNKMSFTEPKNMAFSTSPGDNMEFKFQQHLAVLKSIEIIKNVSEKFKESFGRSYGGLTEEYRCDNADVVIITLGSVSGTVKNVVDELREKGIAVGMVRIRFMRPFPEDDIRKLAGNTKAIAVLEKDISFGYEGTVFTNVCSAVAKTPYRPVLKNFIAGLGGRSISRSDIESVFLQLLQISADESEYNRVEFIGSPVLLNS